MKKTSCYFLLLIFFCLNVQSQTFRAGIAGGVNFSQIDGDNIGGYNKFGVNTGFLSELPFTDRWSVGFELLFAQKGSRAVITANNPFDFKIILDYAEIPVIAKFHDRKGGFTFGAGFALGRLVRSRYFENGIDATESYFSTNKANNWEWSIVADISYMFTPVWGVNLRGAYSLLPVRKDPNSVFRASGQFNNVLTVRSIFMFSAIGKNK
ncbi:MAG: PorT family protein [Sphingobacteriales bacterium]|nr:MAG: PorT family protein [Sphingobacteriales bacterium]